MAGRYVLDTGAVVAYADVRTGYTRRPDPECSCFQAFPIRR